VGSVRQAEPARRRATGRRPDFADLGLERAGVAYSNEGITVDDQLRTSARHIFAAGDCTGGYQFTHFAGWQAFQAVRNALLPGSSRGFSDAVPSVTFTDPEVASVGLTEATARRGGRKVRTGFARLIDAEKAQIDGIEHGHVRCIADAKTGELLGCHIVAENAGDMIHEAVAMMAARTPIKVVANAMHAYPTLSELMRSALRDAGG